MESLRLLRDKKHRRHTTPGAHLPPATFSKLQASQNGPKRSRQLSAARVCALNVPKSTARSSLTFPAFVPWDRSLRSSQPTYIPGPGFGPTRRSSSKSSTQALPKIVPRTAASNSGAAPVTVASTTKPTPLPPFQALTAVPRGPARRRSGAAGPHSLSDMEDVSTAVAVEEGGLSTSSAVSPSFSTPPRRPSAHVNHTLHIILGADARDEAAALTAYTSPNVAVFAAYDALRLLLIPLWWRYRYHKQLARATATVSKFVLAKVHEWRRRRKQRAADAILCLLQAPRTQLLCAAWQLELRVVRIQRAFRVHRRLVQAVVELNYRKIRRDVEKAYWAAVVAQREAELAAQAPTTSAVAKAVQAVLDAKYEVHTRFGTVRRSSLVGGGASPTAAAAAAATTPAPASYELDVYNYYMIGRLPESTLRLEIASAVFAHTRRSAERARLLDELCTPKQSQRRDAKSGLKAQTPRLRCQAQLPRLLPESMHTSIMNNTCYMTSLMRDDAMLRAHLKPRPSLLEPY
jgi:hypothetical protein